VLREVMKMTEPVDMQAAVDRLAVAVGHSVLIEDVDQYPVWWSTIGAVDRTRMRTILNRHVDPAAAAVIDRFNLADAVGPVRTPAMPDADMWARWCVPIRHNDRLLGFLWCSIPIRRSTRITFRCLSPARSWRPRPWPLLGERPKTRRAAAMN
jgi:hypothetical protein